MLPLIPVNVPPLSGSPCFTSNQLLKKQLMSDPDSQVTYLQNVLESDGIFAYKEKELGTSEIDQLRDGLNVNAYNWTIKLDGVVYDVILEPLDTKRRRTHFLLHLNVYGIKKTDRNPFIMIGMQIYPHDIGLDSTFVFFHFGLRDIAKRDNELYGPIWQSDKYTVPLPTSLVFFAHVTKGNVDGPDSFVHSMANRSDGTSFRNPISLESPATFESIQLMKAQKVKTNRQSPNLKLIGLEHNLSTSLENAVPHCRKVEESLRENDKGLFRVKFDDFNEERPKCVKVNCHITPKILSIMEQLWVWGRITPVHLMLTDDLIKAQRLAAQLKADNIYWILAEMSAVLGPIEKSYTATEFFQLFQNILYGRQVENLIRDSRKDGKVKLVGCLIILSPFLFVCYQSGGIENLPHEVLNMGPELTNLMVEMKDNFETAMATSETVKLFD